MVTAPTDVLKDYLQGAREAVVWKSAMRAAGLLPTTPAVTATKAVEAIRPAMVPPHGAKPMRQRRTVTGATGVSIVLLSTFAGSDCAVRVRRFEMAAGVVAALTLAACASSATGGGSGQPQVRTRAQLGFYGSPDTQPIFPVVTGGFGDEPHVGAIPKQPLPTGSADLYISEGTGEPVSPRPSPLVRYVQMDWTSGQILHDTWSAGAQQETLGGPNLAALSLINGVRIGTRLQVIVPMGDGTLNLFVIDIIANGTAAPTSSAP